MLPLWIKILCIVFSIAITIILIEKFCKNKTKVFSCGYTVDEVKTLFNTATYCGQYWAKKSSHNRRTKEVVIEMEGNEKLTYNMLIGTGVRKDLDYDGCSIQNNFVFNIKRDKEGNLYINRKIDLYFNPLDVIQYKKDKK